MNVDSKNQIWYTQEKNMINVGFTKSFLDSLDECWHILPANNKKFTKKAPLLTIETNDSLLSILSPFEGYFMSFNTKASNFPEKIVETDVILEINLDKAQQANMQREAEVAQPVEVEIAANLFNNAPIPRWGNAHEAADAIRQLEQFRAQLAQAHQPPQRRVQPAPIPRVRVMDVLPEDRWIMDEVAAQQPLREEPF